MDIIKRLEFILSDKNILLEVLNKISLERLRLQNSEDLYKVITEESTRELSIESCVLQSFLTTIFTIYQLEGIEFINILKEFCNINLDPSSKISKHEMMVIINFEVTIANILNMLGKHKLLLVYNNIIKCELMTIKELKLIKFIANLLLEKL